MTYQHGSSIFGSTDATTVRAVPEVDALPDRICVGIQRERLDLTRPIASTTRG